jgi:hypothetical protein
MATGLAVEPVVIDDDRQGGDRAEPNYPWEPRATPEWMR